MGIPYLFIYVPIQWICSIILSYSVQTDSFALSQIKKMRRISYTSLLMISILSILGYNDFFLSSLWVYFIVPILVGLIIVSILYSTLTFIFIFNTTHKMKKNSNDFVRIFSLCFLPVGLFSLKVNDAYSIK